jgi:nucleoside-diphosphate-sugar epimerase
MTDIFGERPLNIALVTGATGFVGQHLVAALRARGCAVRVLALPTEDTSILEQTHVTVYRGDVRQPETLAEPLDGADTVFHLAGIHGPWRPKHEYYSVNVKGTENICRAALAAGTERLIHVSTWAVYDVGLGRSLDENQPLKPLSDHYTVTKAAADRLVQRFIAEEQLPAVIIRPGIMFGPGDRVNFARMADRLLAGRAIIVGSGHNALVFVYVTDVVEGLLLAATQDRAVHQIYNLSNEDALTQIQLWRAIAEEIGTAPPRLHLPYRVLYMLAFLSELLVNSDIPRRQPLITRLGIELFGTDNRVSIDKARRELGFAPRVSLRKGVHLAASWYLQQKQESAVTALRDESRHRAQPV